jgi:hypothetical protein
MMPARQILDTFAGLPCPRVLVNRGKAMNAMNDAREMTGEQVSSLTVSETYWGYILREHDGTADRRDIRDWLLIFLGGVLILAALGQWFYPGSVFSQELLSIKIALTATMAGLGLGCLHAAMRAAHVEVQVDTVKRELRVVERDRMGDEKVVQRLPMRDIDSAYVKRGTHASEGGHLLLRVAGSEKPLHLASGSERELRLLHDRLRNDLRPARERVERRLLREAAQAMPPQRPEGRKASA